MPRQPLNRHGNQDQLTSPLAGRFGRFEQPGCYAASTSNPRTHSLRRN